MNTTFSVRVEDDLKKKFLEKSKQSGFDGSSLLRYFMKTYVEKDNIVSIDIDEKLFDEMFQDIVITKKLKKVSSKLDEVWF